MHFLDSQLKKKLNQLEKNAKISLVKEKPLITEVLSWEKMKIAVVHCENTDHDCTRPILTQGQVQLVLNEGSIAIQLDTYDKVIFARNIIAYSAPSLFLTQNDPLTFPYAISLKVGTRVVRVNRDVLMDKCAYFKGMFSSGMKESTNEEIDLSNLFVDEAWFDAFLNFLKNTCYSIESIEEALLFLAMGDALSYSEMMRYGLNYIAINLSSKKLDELVASSENYHPLIRRFLWNVHQYPYKGKFSKFGFVSSFSHDELLYIDDYQKTMYDYCMKLTSLTRSAWTYSNGEVKSSCIGSPIWKEWDWNHHDKIFYLDLIVEILKARGILSGTKQFNKWCCRVKEAEKLLALAEGNLKNEIETASSLIQSITAHQCNLLLSHRYPSFGARCEMKLLEEVSCISIKRYINTILVTNFNLDKLRLLEKLVIEKGEKWKVKNIWQQQRESISADMKAAFVQALEQAQTKPVEHTNKTISTSAFSLMPYKEEEQKHLLPSGLIAEPRSENQIFLTARK